MQYEFRIGIHSKQALAEVMFTQVRFRRAGALRGLSPVAPQPQISPLKIQKSAGIGKGYSSGFECLWPTALKQDPQG